MPGGLRKETGDGRPRARPLEAPRWVEEGDRPRQAESTPPEAPAAPGARPPAAADAADGPERGDEEEEHGQVTHGGEEEMQVEEDDPGDLMESLLTVPDTQGGGGARARPSRRVRREATQILDLLLIAGVSLRDARAKVAELYSPPRVTAALGRIPHLSLAGGPTFDLRADADGRAWDLRDPDHRRRARAQIAREKPYVVIWEPAVHSVQRPPKPQPRPCEPVRD